MSAQQQPHAQRPATGVQSTDILRQYSQQHKIPHHVCESELDNAGDRPKAPYTTIMLRNLPNRLTREWMRNILKRQGFDLLYNFLYVPIDFQTQAGLGYCFINFIDHSHALEAKRTFSGF